MKKIIAFLVVFILAFGFSGCDAVNRDKAQEKLLRIHIRANSNDQADQEVKLKVRDGLNEFITKIIGKERDYNSAYNIVKDNLAELKEGAEEILSANGFSYDAKASLKNEFFPTRNYGDLVVDSGYYDAVIIELGEGAGDNWWCVVYPPLCYVSASANSDIEYKWLIEELWKKYFG